MGKKGRRRVVTAPPLERLHDLYAELPTIECKGYCANSCGPIDMSNVERSRLSDLGVDIPIYSKAQHAAWMDQLRTYGEESLDCPALVDKKSNPFAPKMRMGRCSVYEDRPLICRLWGVVESMPCESGCVVSPRMLTDAEAFDFIFRALDIGGDPAGRNNRLVDVRRRQRQIEEDPEIGPLMQRFIRGERQLEPEIARLVRERDWR